MLFIGLCVGVDSDLLIQTNRPRPIYCGLDGVVVMACG